MRTLGATAVAAAVLLATPVAATAAGTWQGTARGTQARTRHHDEQTSPNVVWDDQQNYQVDLSLSFSIDDDSGAISGTGTGHYTTANWHMAGVNENAAQDNPPKDPHFDCSPPIAGNAFAVELGGSATADTVTLRLAIPEAAEASDDFDCGADFTAFGSTSHYMTDSLADVGGDALTFSRAQPRIPTLVKDVSLNTGRTTGNAHNTWTISLTAPSGSGGSGGAGGGAGGGPTPSGNPPNRSVCTITGSSKHDVLTGTPGPDVICAFGGADVIRGRGGDDVIYAGSGNDRITPGGGKDVVSAGPGADRISARDGKRDRIDGGRGRDRATIDRKLDRVSRVERRS
jgi:hypothetical protein